MVCSRRERSERIIPSPGSSFDFKWSRFKEQVYSSKAVQKWREEFARNFDFYLIGGKLPQSYKTVLDAGCGPCRLFEMVGDDQFYYGIDLSTAAIVGATDRYGVSPNFRVVVGDATKRSAYRGLPGRYHLVVALGVLHHTPDTEEAFRFLASRVRPGGKFLFSVYNRKSPMREFLDEEIRQQTSRMTDDECLQFATIMANVGKELQKADVVVGGLALQQYIYLNVMKCWYAEEYGDDYSACVNFDWYRPRYAWRHSRQEVVRWVAESDLELCRLETLPAAHWVVCRRFDTG